MKLLFVVVVLSLSFACQGQTSDSVRIYDKISPTSFYDLKKGFSSALPLLLQERMKQSTIVVVNGDILSVDDVQFQTLLRNRSYVDLKIVEDKKSKTNIKTIILVKTE